MAVTGNQKSWDGYATSQPQEKLLSNVKEILKDALSKIPVSSFPDLPANKVVEISSESSIAETVEILSKNNIFSAPVKNARAGIDANWSERYLGIIDYGAVILWVLEQAELAAVALAVGSATVAGMGAGAVGALGAFALGATGPVAIAGLTIAAVGAAVAGGFAVDQGICKDAPSAVDALGEEFYKVILQEEPFKSTKVSDITRSFRWTPFLPVQPEDSMLTLLQLMLKFRLRSIPVVEMEKPYINNFITQSAVVRGLLQCRGRDWFEEIAKKNLYELELSVVGPKEVVSVDATKLILEAFTLMREKQIGGLPVLENTNRKIIGNISLRDVQYLLLKTDLFTKHKALTVLEFMEILHSNSSASDPPRMMPAITCTKNTTLISIIETLSEKCIHRIYVIDDQSHVIGVVTLRDIISCFVTEPTDLLDDHFGGLFKYILES